MKMYEVGGCIRDEILGIPSKDIDFSVTLPPGSYRDPFEFMVYELKKQGFEIFLETPEHLTVRARFPKQASMSNGGQFVVRAMNGITADFVLARKEGEYSDGRRPDSVTPGTLEDDLARRDFTMNAIARDPQGNLIDPHNGQMDIATRTINAVGRAQERLDEDALRAVRAMRFSVTKGFKIETSLAIAMQSRSVLESVRSKRISDERIRDELNKMFAHDSVASIDVMHRFGALTEAMLSKTVSLEATMKKRKGK